MSRLFVVTGKLVKVKRGKEDQDEGKEESASTVGFGIN